VRRCQVFLLQEKKLEPSTVEIRISALRFLSKRTLRRRDFTKPCAGLLVELCDHGGRQNDRCDSVLARIQELVSQFKGRISPNTAPYATDAANKTAEQAANARK